MIVLWSSALAAPPPDLDVDGGLSTWEARALALLGGPSGCWELSGTVALTVSGYVPSTRWTRPGKSDHHLAGPFTARIEDGLWTKFEEDLQPVGKTAGREETYDIPVSPLVGRMPADDEEETSATADGAETSEPSATVSLGTGGVSVDDQGGAALSTVQRVLDAIDPATDTAYAQWDDGAGGVVLFQDFPLQAGRGKDVVTIRTVIPDAGPLATAMDVTFPSRMTFGDWPLRLSVFDAQGHVRSQAVPRPDGTSVALPALETLSLGVGAVGFTFAFEQEIRYLEARPCAAP